MKKTLDFHDKQILKIISNPVLGSVQLFISYGVCKIVEIDISEIKRITQENMECLSLFFESAGGLDSGYIDDSGDVQKLFLSGIIDWNQNEYANVYWSFLIEAKKISVSYFSKSENEIDKLMDQEKITIFERRQ